MRDPNRIDEVISALRAYWHAHPDMRLGQIISNAATPDTPGERRSRSEWAQDRPPFDPFYVEDDQILDGIRKLP